MMTKEQLIASLKAKGVLRTQNVIEAFERIDRADFVRPEFRWMAYADQPFPIGFSQTISQPYTVAFMLELLQVKHSDRILDVGSGSGWSSALLASMGKEVDGVERISELVSFSKENISKYELKNVRIHQATKIVGLPGEIFDKILVSCASDAIPKELITQLATGGIMVIPIDNTLVKVVKNADGSLSKEVFSGFVFVPLVKER